MTAATLPPIEGKTTVNVPVEQAFTVFTESFTAWWPHQYHIGQSDVAEVILESHDGGRWYEIGVDGTECDWGRVLAWEPPSRVLFTWQIGGDWQFDPDPAHASEIEVQVSHGEVTLEGTVEDRRTKRLAEDIIEICPGVKQVHNRIRVQGNGSDRAKSSQSTSNVGTSSRTSTRS